jgi:hypothetical protein
MSPSDVCFPNNVELLKYALNHYETVVSYSAKQKIEFAKLAPEFAGKCMNSGLPFRESLISVVSLGVKMEIYDEGKENIQVINDVAEAILSTAHNDPHNPFPFNIVF